LEREREKEREKYPHLATWVNLGQANKDMPQELFYWDQKERAR
jgi:hypothetical protein